MMVLCLVCVWGFRLTHNFVARGGIGHEDWRYADMRVQCGKLFWLVSLVSVFLGQSVFLWGGCLSLYGAMTKPTPLVVRDWIALVVTLGAILLEALADIQMNDFVSARREKKTKKVILEVGLWGWSRHPNYLGEILFWWGLYMFSVGGGKRIANDGTITNDWWVVLGPVSMTLLIGLVSVRLMEKRQLVRKGRPFVRYRRRVGSSLLLLPPALNPQLGRWLYGRSSNDQGGLGNGSNHSHSHSHSHSRSSSSGDHSSRRNRSRKQQYGSTDSHSRSSSNGDHSSRRNRSRKHPFLSTDRASKKEQSPDVEHGTKNERNEPTAVVSDAS